jgi:MFS family permease
MLLQMGSQQMQVFTRGYLVFDLTGSATLLGVVTGAMSLPIVTLGLFGGVLADRLDKRRMIQTAQAMSFFITLGLGVVIAAGLVTWIHLLIASLAQGVAIAFMMPTRQAMIPQLVPRELLTNAVALNAMSQSLLWMLAPAVAGVLVGVIGVDGVYFLMAAMHVFAIVFIGRVPRLEKGTEVGQTLLQDLAQGIRYIVATPQIRLLLMLTFATTLFNEPLRSMLPVFAKEVFEVESGGLGLMLSVMGIGSVVGSLVIASASKTEGRGRRLLVVSLLSGVVLLGFSLVSSFTPAFWLGAAFLAAIGAAQPLRRILSNSLVLENADPQFRGRVMSLFFLLFGMTPAAMLPLGVLTDAIGAPMAFIAMATVMLVLVALMFVFSPVLRRLQ